jgi:murein DD-endopeptidase
MPERKTFNRAARYGLLLGISTMLGGCFQSATVPPAADTSIAIPGTLPDAGLIADPVRSRIVFTALQMIGIPYRYGGVTPQGFDCSGLVQYAYRNAGLSVPRTAREQFNATEPLEMTAMQPGDLVFFESRDYSHVGIYVGENRFVHAPATGRNVLISSLGSSYYQRNFLRAGRFPTVAPLASVLTP